MVSALGDLVDEWITINEPNIAYSTHAWFARVAARCPIAEDSYPRLHQSCRGPHRRLPAHPRVAAGRSRGRRSAPTGLPPPHRLASGPLGILPDDGVAVPAGDHEGHVQGLLLPCHSHLASAPATTTISTASTTTRAAPSAGWLDGVGADVPDQRPGLGDLPSWPH